MVARVLDDTVVQNLLVTVLVVAVVDTEAHKPRAEDVVVVWYVSCLAAVAYFRSGAQTK